MTTLQDDTAAQVAIRDLAARASDAVNRRAPADVAALYAPDGVWVLPGIVDTVGPEAVAATLGGLLEQFPFLVQLLHSGHVDRDGGHATATWYITEHARDRDGTGWLFAGLYRDRLVAGPDGWRFARRRFDFLYRGRVEMPGRTYPFPTSE